MGKLTLFVTALHKGSMLVNSDVWKVRAVAVATVASFLSAIVGLAVAFGWLPDGISDRDIMEISSAIVAVYSIFQAYAHVSTTEKIGIPPRNKKIEEAPNTDDDNDSGVVLDELQDIPNSDNKDARGNTRKPIRQREDPRGVWGGDY